MFKSLFIHIILLLLVGELAGFDTKEIVNNDYGISSIIGPHSGLSSTYIQALSEVHDLPNILIRKEIEHDRLKSINLYPDLDTLAEVSLRLFSHYSFRIIMYSFFCFYIFIINFCYRFTYKW